MKLTDIKEAKSLWEKMNVEGVGKVLLVEESYYDGIVECVEKAQETTMTNFQIEDMDGYEFVKDRSVGGVLISWERDDDEFLTGKVRVIYTDGSGGSISVEEAQKRIDTGHWTVIKN